MAIAAADNSLLLIMALDLSQADSIDFWQNTLQSEMFASILNESHLRQPSILFCDVANYYHYQQSKLFGITQFPAVVFKTAIGSKFQTIAAFEGYLSKEMFGSIFRSCLLMIEAEISRESDLQSSRALHMEQNSAYERSLAADREKKARMTFSGAESTASLRTISQAANEQISDAEGVIMASALSARIEMAVSRLERVPQGTPSLRLSFQLPSGKRVVGDFCPEALIESLFDYAFTAYDWKSQNIVIKLLQPYLELNELDHANLAISHFAELKSGTKLFIDYK